MNEVFNNGTLWLRAMLVVALVTIPKNMAASCFSWQGYADKLRIEQGFCLLFSLLAYIIYIISFVNFIEVNINPRPLYLYLSN